MKPRFRLGELVESTAGRDSGKHYLVVGIIDEKHVELADGDKKKINKAKKKNMKHIRSTGFIDKELSIWLLNGKRVRNEDLKKCLKDYENKEAK
ncbi:MAG TPA: hypothetical protein VKY40_07035 [Halanaerobiales bacterium]|nr:hypothetical protein [Halanaerobiales bacterium]